MIKTLSAQIYIPFILVSAAFASEPDAMWTYKQVDGKTLQMSVFLPDGYANGAAFPTYVIFHGGSWRSGEANWHYPDCRYWAKRGMIAMSVDYRLKDRDDVQVPLECVKDAKSAIRYLRKNAAELKVDANRIVAAGGSAGGQLAAALATIDSQDTNDDSYDLSISCHPNALVLFNPYFRCEPQLSPPEHITGGMPPCVTFLGDQDPAITTKSLRDFHDSLKQNKNVSEYYVGKGGIHGFCNGRNSGNRFFYWSLELTDQFLVKNGILKGGNLVRWPEGVEKIAADGFLAF